MSKSRPGGGKHRRSQSSPDPAYVAESDLRHLDQEAPSSARGVRRTALSVGGACAFVALGPAAAQAAESGTLDSVTGAVGEATASVEDIVRSVVNAAAGPPRAMSEDRESRTDSAAPEPDPARTPEPAPVDPEPATQPAAGRSATGKHVRDPGAARPSPSASEDGTRAEAERAESGASDARPSDRPEPADGTEPAEAGTGSGSSHGTASGGAEADEEPESLLGDLVGDAGPTSPKPLGSLIDTARHLVRLEQSSQPDAASDPTDAPERDEPPDDAGVESPDPPPADEPDGSDDDPVASAADLPDASEDEESQPGSDGELLHSVTPEVIAGRSERTAHPVDEVPATLTPELPAGTEPVDRAVTTTIVPVPAPATATAGMLASRLAPVTCSLLDVTERPIVDRLGTVLVEPLIETVVDDVPDPVLVDVALRPAGNDTAWGPPASDAVGAAALPAAAGETSVATPASLTGFTLAGADVSSNIVIPTTAGAMPAGSGHGVPPAVGSGVSRAARPDRTS